MIILLFFTWSNIELDGMNRRRIKQRKYRFLEFLQGIRGELWIKIFLLISAEDMDFFMVKTFNCKMVFVKYMHDEDLL